MSWDSADKAARSAGKFLNLKDGESATVVLLGEPVDVAGKYGPRIRFNAVDPEGGTAKILELSPTTYGLVKMHRAQLATHAFKLSRTGEGTATVYGFEPVRELTATERTELAQVQLVDLSEQKQATTADAPF